MEQQSICLTVSSLGSDTVGPETLPYEFSIDDHIRIVGKFTGRSSTPYIRHVGTAPAGAKVELVTKDPRLSLDFTRAH